MWLLSTKSLEIRNFYDDKYYEPPYVILSHLWGPEEVSFQDMQGDHDKIRQRLGYVKIKEFCAIAASRGFEFAWVDTCCIDKTNSTELSEAINSMFKWYKDATDCYAYLPDIFLGMPRQVRYSRWFTRGWTLQELLAPSSVIFFDRDWKELGTKSSLHAEISRRTSIPSSVLLFSEDIYDFSIAQRMSWVADRRTTREEDIAYCMLGIFDVAMPMIYGEGLKAFRRLQLEIMKNSTDHSIFAYSLPGHERTRKLRCVLANEPDYFEGCNDICRFNYGRGNAYEMTNRGLHIVLPCREFSNSEGEKLCMAILNCTKTLESQAREPSFLLGMVLKKLDENSGEGMWYRYFAYPLEKITKEAERDYFMKELYIEDKPFSDNADRTRSDGVFWPLAVGISFRCDEDYNFTLVKKWSFGSPLELEGNDFIIEGEGSWGLHFFFSSEDGKECFAVMMDILSGYLFLEVEVGSNYSLENFEAYHANYSPVGKRNRFDRITKPLPSGRLVSAVGRIVNKALPERREQEQLRFEVEISVRK